MSHIFRKTGCLSFRILAGSILTLSCAGTDPEGLENVGVDMMSVDELDAETYLELDTGADIVDGDSPIETESLYGVSLQAVKSTYREPIS